MSDSFPKLKLQPSTRIRLFRCLDSHFRADPDIKQAIKVFRSWRGEAADRHDHSSGQYPWCSLTIRGTPLQQWASSTKTGEMVIDIAVAVAGTCLDDLDNTWALFERSCYPADAAARLALQRRLREMGAHTGRVSFGSPVFDPRPEGGYLLGEGSLSIEYRFDEHPTTPGY